MLDQQENLEQMWLRSSKEKQRDSDNLNRELARCRSAFDLPQLNRWRVFQSRPL